MKDKVEITALKGDGGWTAKGSLFNYGFTASLPAAGWNSKGWRVGKTFPQSDIKEQREEVFAKIKSYLDENHLKGYVEDKQMFVPTSKYLTKEDMMGTPKKEIKKAAAKEEKPKKEKKEKKESRPDMLKRKIKNGMKLENAIKDPELLERYANHVAWIKNDYAKISKEK